MKNTPLHIVLIDDDQEETEIFEDSLKQTGFVIDYRYALSANKGIEFLQAYSPDYIFLDLNMPEMNGFECIKKIRSDDRFSTVPIILYSSDVDEHILNEGLSVGANNCIKKSFGPHLSRTLTQLFAADHK